MAIYGQSRYGNVVKLGVDAIVWVVCIESVAPDANFEGILAGQPPLRPARFGAIGTLVK